MASVRGTTLQLNHDELDKAPLDCFQFFIQSNLILNKKSNMFYLNWISTYIEYIHENLPHRKWDDHARMTYRRLYPRELINRRQREIPSRL